MPNEILMPKIYENYIRVKCGHEVKIMAFSQEELNLQQRSWRDHVCFTCAARLFIEERNKTEENKK